MNSPTEKKETKSYNKATKIFDFKISAVLNPKGLKSDNGESIYICIYNKVRQYIHLGLEKIPKKAWSGETSKWVNNELLFADHFNRIIAREITRLENIIINYKNPKEPLTTEMLKNIYLVEYQGRTIKGIDPSNPIAKKQSIVSFIDYSLSNGYNEYKTEPQRERYIILKHQMQRFNSNAVMADINETFVLEFANFMRKNTTSINSDETVKKNVNSLKSIYLEFTSENRLYYYAKFFEIPK
jgi:hypothetical protein